MTTIEITGVRVRRVIVPARRPLRAAVADLREVPFLLIDLETRGGVTGRMLGFTFARMGLALLPPVIEELGRFGKGRALSLAELPAFHDACQRKLTMLGHEGVMQMALSMFDMTVYDALARAAGMPLYKLLGAQSVAIPTYNSCGLGLMEPKELAREAKELAAENGGYRHVKMRLGRSRAADELAAIRAVREAIGPDVLLSADFNQALPALSAYDTCRAIDGQGLVWIEEPVLYDDYDTQARLATKLTTPIQIGENWYSWRVGKAAIEKGACDNIMPDVLRIGGVTGWLRLARVAEASGVPFSSHLSPDFSAHLLAATPTRHWLEYMDWAQELTQNPTVPEAGFVRPKETPGAGIEWNERAIEPRLVTH
jgi:mandelate racemase